MRVLDIFVDADACPVKQEIYRVAERYKLTVILVSNTWMNIPHNNWLKLMIVDDQLDAADNWIVDHVEDNDIVITTDIPLASRCLAKNTQVLTPKGRIFSENSIGDALANRELHSHLRDLGIMTGGSAPFQKKDRSRFLQS